MRDYQCVDCGTVASTTARGSIPLRCAECRKADARQRVREHRARKWVGPPTFTCVGCGATGEGRSDRKRCDKCQVEFTRDYERKYYRENLAPPERTWTCVDCGTTGVQARKGTRLRCVPCDRRVKADRVRVPDLGPTPCVDCGVPVPRSTGTTRRRPVKRCPTCQAAWKLVDGAKYRAENVDAVRARNAAWKRANPEQVALDKARRRAREYGVGFEEFDPVEIFERDGWVCYLCGLAVDPEMRYPDPRSASLDHVHPLSAGGPHSRDNTACTHLTCNVRKNDKIIQMEE